MGLFFFFLFFFFFPFPLSGGSVPDMRFLNDSHIFVVDFCTVFSVFNAGSFFNLPKINDRKLGGVG